MWSEGHCSMVLKQYVLGFLLNSECADLIFGLLLPRMQQEAFSMQVAQRQRHWAVLPGAVCCGVPRGPWEV